MASLLSIGLTIVAIGIALLIAIRQRKQLEKLEEIGIQTKETTEKLKTKEWVDKVVNDFFCLQIKEVYEEMYKYIFPVEYRRKPLPFINQGDFYAIQVLNSYIGEDKLKPIGITKDEQVKDDLLNGNVIFLCSPNVNPALNRIFEAKEIRSDKDESDTKKWLLEKIKLPCWFVTDYRNSGGQPIKKIKIVDEELDISLKSLAEKSYSAARDLKEGATFEFTTDIEEDFGILARVSKDNNRYIIIAGIHQYGTWITADFLRCFLSREEIDPLYESIFRSDKDFIAVIWGEFNNLTMTVKRRGVDRQHLWAKDDNDKWNRIRLSEGKA